MAVPMQRAVPLPLVGGGRLVGIRLVSHRIRERIVDGMLCSWLELGDGLRVERAEQALRPVKTADGERTAIAALVRAVRGPGSA